MRVIDDIPLTSVFKEASLVSDTLIPHRRRQPMIRHRIDGGHADLLRNAPVSPEVGVFTSDEAPYIFQPVKSASVPLSEQNLQARTPMDDWIDYYDSTHTIYASKRHRDLHFEVIASDIIGYIPSPDAIVLDYACGEALSAARVAEACGRLILAEPAPGVRGRLIARFAPNPRIRVRSLEELRGLEKGSVDLAILNSAAQYMTPAELDGAFVVIRRALRPDGRLVVGDILDPRVGIGRDVMALLRFGAERGFLKDALFGLVRTALSDYRQLRSRVGLQRYSEAEMLAKLRSAGFSAVRASRNIGHNPARMTFTAQPAR